MKFVDDVEFYLDKDLGVIQVRSASRLGESDLGVNRKRVEALREKLGETVHLPKFSYNRRDAEIERNLCVLCVSAV